MCLSTVIHYTPIHVHHLCWLLAQLFENYIIWERARRGERLALITSRLVWLQALLYRLSGQVEGRWGESAWLAAWRLWRGHHCGRQDLGLPAYPCDPPHQGLPHHSAGDGSGWISFIGVDYFYVDHQSSSLVWIIFMLIINHLHRCGLYLCGSSFTLVFYNYRHLNPIYSSVKVTALIQR